MTRVPLALGLRPSAVRHELALVYRVDALLAPVGLLAAFGAAEQPYAALLVLPLVAALVDVAVADDAERPDPIAAAASDASLRRMPTQTRDRVRRPAEPA